MRGKRYSIEEVRKIFEDNGCKLLSESYENEKQKLDYICSCGVQSITKLRYFNIGRRCQKCGRNKFRETVKKNGSFRQESFVSKRKATWMRKYGVENIFQSEEIKAKRRKTSLERYGVEEISCSPEMNKKQRDGFLSKYGVNHFYHVKESKDKYNKTMMDRYGTTSLTCLSGQYSKVSQKLFFGIYDRLPKELQEKTYFAELNHEFYSSNSEGNYKYDFVISNIKFCLEFNGSKFHPKETQEEGEVGWCVFHPNLTVKEARIKESKKMDILKSRGFSCHTVWDHEYKENPLKVIDYFVDLISSADKMQNQTPELPELSFPQGTEPKE